ncbi:glycosyltransferase family 4 protein [Clostridium tyrobutyricum]|uniref:glycosyltransferase family 4 protein n=1 Tax=Clostridium tyrobutyricum TaxID=1519 RepID=UPI00057EF679|nr:glycosyltransferase family 4 protein [Clostridium tyrobutyricum]
MKIGYIGSGYPERRMIIDKIDEFKYIKLSPYCDIKILIFSIMEKICIRLKNNFIFFNRIVFNYKPIWNKKLDILHLFNRIYYGKKDWVITFENTIPTFRDVTKNYKLYSKKRVKYLVNKNCKAILPMSNWAYRRTVSLWNEITTKDEVNKLIAKTKVMQPPQNILICYDKISNKFNDINQEIRFVFVGRDFWRKGGEIVVKALEKIRENHNIKLTIISKLNITEQAYNPKSNIDMLTYFDSNVNWIKHYSELSNSKVIEVFKNSHIGLLPTWFDTYGFSVLEMQACACPVITTNINALPEINNNDRGWLIDTQSIIKKIGNNYFDVDICNKTRNYMIYELKNCIENILTRRSEIKHKAICSYQYIQTNHLEKDYRKKMKLIYKSF